MIDFKIEIRLKTMPDIALFVDKCAAFGEDIDFHCGRFIIDGKSIMGMMSTASNLGQKSIVKIYTNNPHTIDRFLEEMKLWAVEE